MKDEETAMRSYRQVCLVALLILALGLFVSLPVFAVEPPAIADAQAQTSPPTAPATGTPQPDDGWHFAATPYLWFPGVSGTSGALGHNVGIHVSPGELLSHFHLGVMGAFEARKSRVVVPVDFMWVNLRSNKGLPFDQGFTSIQVKLTESILTPKIGYRIVDDEKVKVDALIGFRYWHLGENLSFQPSGLLGNLSPTQNWVDAVAGGKIEAVLSPKVIMTIAGDAGGGGSDLDYQALGALGLKVSRKVILQVGYRYLFVNYRTNPPKLFVFDAHSSGALLGVTFNLK
jgi:hypothetical protein